MSMNVIYGGERTTNTTFKLKLGYEWKQLVIEHSCVSFACISAALLCTVLQMWTSDAPVTH